MIVAYVKGQELKVTQPIIVADTIDYLTASFSFKTADWNELQKWAHFKHGESVYDVLLNDDKIEKNAHLNLSAGEWELYLHGTAVENGVAVERITTEIATLTVKPTGALNGEVLPDVPPTAAEQILAVAQEAVNVANSVRDDADSGAFDGRDGQDGRDGVDGRNGADGADAKINGYNTVNIVAGKNIAIDQDGNTLTISSTGGGGGASSWDDLTDKPFDFIDGNTLIARDGVLAVNTTDVAEQDNTKPITSSGVHVIVGNIDTLLSLI